MTGKYELPQKWILIRSIKESETGCEKFHFDTKVEFYTMIIDLSINYGINLDDFSEAIMAFESYQVMGIIGERFVGIYYEDKKFVARAGIDPIEENWRAGRRIGFGRTSNTSRFLQTEAKVHTLFRVDCIRIII